MNSTTEQQTFVCDRCKKTRPIDQADTVNGRCQPCWWEICMLADNLVQRNSCWNKHKNWLKEASKRKGKGTVNRKWFISRLEWLAKVLFKSADDEYEQISKFGRGMWDFKYIDSFTEEEKKIIIDEIAHEYGAFSY